MPRNKTKRQRNRGGDAAEPSQSSVDDESTAIASSSAAEQSSAPTGLNSMLEVTGISEIVNEMSRYSNPETGFDGMAHTVINSVLGQLGRPDGVPKDLWDAKNDDRTRRAATLLATLRSWRQRGLVISLTEPEQDTKAAHEFWSKASEDLDYIQTLDGVPPTIPLRWLDDVNRPLTLIRAMSWAASDPLQANNSDTATYKFRCTLWSLRNGSSPSTEEKVSLMSDSLAERYCKEMFEPDPDSPIKKRADRAFRKHLTAVVPLLKEAGGRELDQSTSDKISAALTSAILSDDQEEEWATPTTPQRAGLAVESVQRA